MARAGLRGRVLSLAVLWAMAFTAAGYAGDASRNPDDSRKIGIALSGGGARGIAHIGVLAWLEEHRIPVACVAGTSMGGLVGGLYAIGMSPSEIGEFMQSIDWVRALASRPDYRELSFRRKEDRRNYQVEFQMGAKHGFRVAPGLSSAQDINLMIDRLTLPYSTVSNFDDLPIPFWCTATDLLTGEPLILKGGSLASAMQATMAIPGVFPPVERDAKVLVDGGLLNNLPADLAREMKADIVIAVDIGTKLSDLKTIETLQGILRQTMTVMTIDSDRRNLPLADAIITPELGDHSILDFSEIKRLIQLGYEGAGAKSADLLKYSIDDASWGQYVAARNARKRTVVPVPETVRVTGVSARAQVEIQNLLKPFTGKPLDIKRLEASLTMLAGQGRYENLDYLLAQSETRPASDVLVIKVKEKPYAPPTLDFGLQLDGSDLDAVHFNIGTRMTLYDAGKYGSEWRNDIRVGYNALLESEYLFPIGHHGIFAASDACFSRSIEKLFSFSGDRSSDYRTNRLALSGALGFLTRRTEFRVGYEIGRFTADVHSGEPSLRAIAGVMRRAFMRWAFDGTDSATMPSRGLRLSAESEWVQDAPLSAASLPKAEMTALWFLPVSGRGSVFVNSRIGTTFNKTAPPELMFTLGGPFRLGAYEYQEFRGSHSLLGSLGYRHQIGSLSPLWGGRIYGVTWFDAGGAYADFKSPVLQYQGSAGVMMDTKLGSFALIGAAGKGKNGKIYAAFGKFL
jgi:NTE family protein